MFYCFNTKQIPTITYMNRNIAKNSWKHFSRTAEEYILYLVNDGVMYLSENNTQYELHSGDMLLLQPVHTHTGYQESICDYSYIHFPKTAFSACSCDDKNTIEQIMLDNRNLFYTCNPLNNELYDKAQLILPKQMHIGDQTRLYKIWQYMESAIHSFDIKSDHFKLECSCNAVEILIQLYSTFSAQLLYGNRFYSTIVRNNIKV